MRQKLDFYETLSYHREIVFDLPEDIDEDELDSLYYKIQNSVDRNKEPDAIYEVLEQTGATIVERADDDTHYPTTVEIEIMDMFELDGHEDGEAY